MAGSFLGLCLAEWMHGHCLVVIVYVPQIEVLYNHYIWMVKNKLFYYNNVKNILIITFLKLYVQI